MIRTYAIAIAAAAAALFLLAWSQRADAQVIIGSSAPPAGPETAYVAPDGRSFDQLVADHVMPNPDTTPGALNPDVTDATIQQTICSKAKDAHGYDWVHDQRPPDSVTDPEKIAALPHGWTVDDCEWDHLQSIEDGGAPRDPRNLWCMAYKDRYGARVKDVLETKLWRIVCKGVIDLPTAHAALAPNWMIGYVRFVGPLPK